MRSRARGRGIGNGGRCDYVTKAGLVNRAPTPDGIGNGGIFDDDTLWDLLLVF